MSLNEALPFLIPLVIVQVVLIGIGLYDLLRPDRRVRGGSKVIWGIVIVLISIFGPLVYFLFGREEG